MLSFNRSVAGGWQLITANVPQKNPIHFFQREVHAWASLKMPRLADVLIDKHDLPPNLNFTAINENYITRKLHEIREIYRCIGVDTQYSHKRQRQFRNPIDIVVFNPARTATQLTAAILATEIKMESDHHFKEVCQTIDSIVQCEIKNKKSHFDGMPKEIEETVHEIVTRCKNRGESDVALEQAYLAIAGIIQDRFEGMLPASTVERVASKILFDDLHREKIRNDVYDLAQEVISHEISAQGMSSLPTLNDQDRQQVLLFLPHFSAENRVTKVVAGGIGTGKSSIAKQLIAQLKVQYGLSLADFAVLSTDRLRLALFDSSLGDDARMKGTLTQDEANMIKQLGLDLISKKLDTLKSAPHLFLEVVSPTESEIELGTKCGSKMQISVTSYPPELAVDGAYRRFQATQERLPPVNAILTSQQYASEEVPRLIQNHINQEIQITLYDTYKLIHSSEDTNTFIASIDCKKNQMAIFDIDNMLEFIKKTQINTRAENSDSIFPNASALTQEKLITSLLDQYGVSKLYFIAPDKNKFNLKTINEHAYAEFDLEQGLVVHDQAMFDAIQMASEAAVNLFNKMSDKVMHKSTLSI